MRTLLFLLITFLFIQCQSTELSEQASYDRASGQQPVLSKQKIDSILNSFEQLSYKDLDKEYLQKTASAKYRDMIYDKTWYVIKGRDIFKYLVGYIRVKDLLCPDDYYKENLQNLDLNKKQYLLIDRKLLYKTLDLINELDKYRYDPYAYTVNHAHRHPVYNDSIGGAYRSRHIRGQAIDLKIGDINKDGKVTQEDKAIVLDILENKIIGNQGGIGRYPKSMVIHYDTRGYRARWDSYTPHKK